MDEIKAHENVASNLLRLNCKINEKIVGFLLDSKVTNLFMIPQVVKMI